MSAIDIFSGNAGSIEQPLGLCSFTAMGRKDFGPGIGTPTIDAVAAASGGDLTMMSQNYILQSQTIATGAAVTVPWVIYGDTVAPPTLLGNAVSAPDGTTTATKIDFPATSAANQRSIIYQAFTGTAVPWTFSFWVKTVSGTGTLYVTTVRTGLDAENTAVPVTDSWRRVSITRTLTSSPNWFLVFGPSGSGWTPSHPSSQPALSVYIWGVQASPSATERPYVPTTTTAIGPITKNGAPTTVGSPFFKEGASTTDRAVKLDGGADYWDFGDLPIPNDFTLFVSFKPLTRVGAGILWAKDTSGAGSHGFNVYYYSDGKIYAEMYNDAGTPTSKELGTWVSGQWNVLALSYRFVADGTSIVSCNLNGTAPAQTTNSVGPIKDTVVPLRLGAMGVDATKLNFFTGDIARASFWTGFAATQAQLAQMVASQMGLLATRPNTNLVTHTRSDATFCCPLNDSEGYWLAPNVPAIHGSAYAGGSGIEVYGIANNIFGYSETLETGTVDYNLVTTDNIAVSPAGTTTASRIVSQDTTGVTPYSVIQSGFAASAVPYTLSVWLKADAGTPTVYLSILDAGAATYYKTACVLSTTWKRFSLTTAALTAATWYFEVGVDKRDVTQVGQLGATYYAWGAQITATAFAVPYRATAAGVAYLGAAGTATTCSTPTVLAPTSTAGWTNLCLQSETIATAAAMTAPWVKYGNVSAAPTVSANAALAPDGSFTATLVNFASINGATHYSVVQQPFTSTAVPYTLSGWARTVTGTGTLYANLNGATHHTSGWAVTTTWQRFSVTGTLAVGTTNIEFGPNGSATGEPTAQAALSVYLWGVQVELGSSMKPYLPTTTVPVTATAGGGVAKSVTNLVRWSERFDNAAWTKISGGGPAVPVVSQDTFDVYDPQGRHKAAKVVFPAVQNAGEYSLLRAAIPGSLAGYLPQTLYARTLSGTATIYIAQGNSGLFTACNVTTEWTRFINSKTTGFGSETFDIGVNLLVGGEAGQPAQTVYIFGAQADTTAGYYVGPTEATALTQTRPYATCNTWTNKCLQSETIATGTAVTAPWTLVNVGATAITLNANAGIAPDSSFTADLLNLGATDAAGEASAVFQSVTMTAEPWTFSVWLRTVTGSGTAYISIDNGTNAISYTACAVTTTWQRFSVTRTASAGAWYAVVGPYITAYGTPQPTVQPALSVLAWGAQVEVGSNASPYLPTTTVARTAGPNAALGKVVTNLALQSESLTTTWTTFKLTSITGGQSDYKGGSSGWKMLEDSTSGYHYLTQGWTATNVPHTMSCYAKAGTRSWICLSCDQGTSSGFFDLTNGVLGTMTSGTGSMEAVGGGWYRLRFTSTPAAGAQFALIFMATANGGHNYLGDGAGSIYVMQPQLEASPAAGFYVPTAAAAVTAGPSQKWAVGVTANHSLPLTAAVSRGIYTIKGTSGADANYFLLYSDGFSYFDVFDDFGIMKRVAVNLAVYPATTKTFTVETNNGNLAVYANGVRQPGGGGGTGFGYGLDGSVINLGVYGLGANHFNGNISRLVQARTVDGCK